MTTPPDVRLTPEEYLRIERAAVRVTAFGIGVQRPRLSPQKNTWQEVKASLTGQAISFPSEGISLTPKE